MSLAQPMQQSQQQQLLSQQCQRAQADIGAGGFCQIKSQQAPYYQQIYDPRTDSYITTQTSVTPQIIGQSNTKPATIKTEIKPGGKSMLKEISTDVKGFIKDNRQVIYWMAFLLLVDHFIFQDKFKTKLHDLVSGLIGKVEKSIAKE